MPVNVSLSDVRWNETQLWGSSPLELDVFYNPDVVIIVMYVVVLAASLSANTLLIFIVIKFQYMRRPNISTFETSSLSVCSDSTTGSEGRFYREEAGKKLSSCSFPTLTIYILHL
ncbi:jg25070 [Pararge aegeria aegeria]|uniref:Jg25070 protein n=1 Tax=Pararge aegeria aegeria TaxID=348720 RepID=A0A8S4SIK7_9NEOP|nr:jg25070 [Pararge aegeria aegeria]